MRHALHTLYKKGVEAVTAPLSKSQFDEKRVLTPEEFVVAGDYLVHACPTWSWDGGDPKKRRQFFPADKQYLVTRNVPCLKRASDVTGYNPNTEFAVAGEEDWVATHEDPACRAPGGGDDDIPSIDDAGAKPSTSKAGGGGGGRDDDDVPDISELDLGDADDEAALPSGRGGGGSGGTYLRAGEPADNIVRTRTYDLFITYDQYYQVPRFWLVGYDESKKPLTPQQVMEDVSEEHARKTITVDPHPNLALSAASIHPCRHAEVMKKLVDNLLEAGRDFQVQHYLVLFLKFIASVVPTIQYDYTMSVGGE